MRKKGIYSAVLSALFTAFIVICSLFTIPAPIPFTLQTLGVFLAAAYLEPASAILCVVVYTLLGVVGLPVFSGFQGGLGVLLGPTGGFVLGFLFIPLICGFLCRFFTEKFKFFYMLAGLLVCYVTGSLWYMLYTDAKSFWAVITITVVPFIIPDVLKLVVALKLAQLLKKVTDKIIPPDTDSLNAFYIKKHISDDINVYTYEEIDSTNSEAVRKLNEGVELPALFVAERQSAGRGRLGRSFYSCRGGLYMTLAVKTTSEQVAGITALVGVAVAEIIEKLTKSKASIKWVNDIYIEDKKAGGILCESFTDKQTGKMSAVVIGIGINLNVKDFPEDIKEIAGTLYCKNLSKNLLAAKITQRIFELLNGDEDYISIYRQKSAVLGKEIFYIKNGVRYDAIALDVDSVGGLVVENSDGSRDILTGGEITLRIK